MRVCACVSVRVIEKERENYLVFSQLSSTMPRAEYNSNPPLSQKPDDDDIKKMVEKSTSRKLLALGFYGFSSQVTF